MKIFKGLINYYGQKKEVFPDDEKFMQRIWKYLNLEDRLNCRLVCKRFNEIISGPKFLGQNVYFPSTVEKIPKLTTNHETVIIEGLNCNLLDVEVRQKLKQFNNSLIHLELLHCTFYLTTLYQILSELPLLESLKFHHRVTMNTSIELTNYDLKNLLNFEEIKMEIVDDLNNDILDNTKNALNIKIVLFFDYTTVNMNDFNDSMDYKSRKDLNFMNCLINKESETFFYLRLHLNSNTHIFPIDSKSFDCLKELNNLKNNLKLNVTNDEIEKILKFKCIDGLSGLTVDYTVGQKTMLFEKIQYQIKLDRMISEHKLAFT